jgi:hypothetical protein
LKLLRTIRLDPSDTFIFDRAAEPGEFAVSGSFVFLHENIASLVGKARSAFRGGFLGVESWAWSTLVQIVEAKESDYVAGVEKLAEQLVANCGAPTSMEAEPAAEAEFAFAQALCTHPAGTLIAVHRVEENGDIRETFRALRPKDGPKPFRAFAFLDAEDDEDPGEWVDLLALGSKRDGET